MTVLNRTNLSAYQRCALLVLGAEPRGVDTIARILGRTPNADQRHELGQLERAGLARGQESIRRNGRVFTITPAGEALADEVHDAYSPLAIRGEYLRHLVLGMCCAEPQTVKDIALRLDVRGQLMESPQIQRQLSLLVGEGLVVTSPGTPSQPATRYAITRAGEDELDAGQSGAA